MVARPMFDPEVFKMWDKVLTFTKVANQKRIGEVWQICLLESIVAEVWILFYQSDFGGHRGLGGTQRIFHVISKTEDMILEQRI